MDGEEVETNAMLMTAGGRVGRIKEAFGSGSSLSFPPHFTLIG